MKKQSGVRGMEISQEQLFGKGQFSDLLRQIAFDNHALGLCCTAALNTWNNTEE